MSLFKFIRSNKRQRETESKSSELAKRRKESQQHYEQKGKRRFQKNLIEDFNGMDITKYHPDQYQHITLTQTTKWSTKQLDSFKSSSDDGSNQNQSWEILYNQ